MELFVKSILLPILVTLIALQLLSNRTVKLGGFDTPKEEEPQEIVQGSPRTQSEVSQAFSSDIYTPVLFHRLVTMSPNVVATSTRGTGYALTQRDLMAGGFYVVQLGIANTDFTYTLPASSSFTSLVANVGERARNCFYNVASSTSAGADLIFAAGTGIDIAVSTTTRPVPLGVAEKNIACIDFIRQSQIDQPTRPGDITAVLELYHDAD